MVSTMNPKQCIEKLMAAGWREADIGARIGVAQATINRIKTGETTATKYTTALALEALARKPGKPPR